MRYNPPNTVKPLAFELANSAPGTTMALTAENIDAFRATIRNHHLPLVARFDRDRGGYFATRNFA
jgi:hypothetical protein